MTIQIYVGTYAKYNTGDLKGAWLDMEQYGDKDSFYEACRELHKDEHDPEFMFQDFEGIPKGLVGESFVKDELWDWLALDEDDRALLAVYQEHVRDDADIDEARDKYLGKYESKIAWAEEHLEESGSLESIPENLRYYFNYEAWARDAEIGGDVCFVRHDGDLWVFSNH